MCKLIKNKDELRHILYQIIESEPFGTVWTTEILLKEINKKLTNGKSFHSTRQVGKIISFQRKHRTFKSLGNPASYIFIKGNHNGSLYKTCSSERQ